GDRTGRETPWQRSGYMITCGRGLIYAAGLALRRRILCTTLSGIRYIVLRPGFELFRSGANRRTPGSFFTSCRVRSKLMFSSSDSSLIVKCFSIITFSPSHWRAAPQIHTRCAALMLEMTPAALDRVVKRTELHDDRLLVVSRSPKSSRSQ